MTNTPSTPSPWVRDLMTTPAITASPDATFGEIVELLLDRDISGVPVVDDEGRLLGMVTEADLVSNAAYGGCRRGPLDLLANFLRGHDPQWVRKASALTARELMTAEPDIVLVDDPIATAARRLLEGQHKRLPVIADDQVVGVISRHDVLRAFEGL